MMCKLLPTNHMLFPLADKCTNYYFTNLYYDEGELHVQILTNAIVVVVPWSIHNAAKETFGKDHCARYKKWKIWCITHKKIATMQTMTELMLIKTLYLIVWVVALVMFGVDHAYYKCREEYAVNHGQEFSVLTL